MATVELLILGFFFQLHAQLCLTLWNPRDITCKAPLSMGLSQQKYWIGLSFIPPVCFHHKVKVKVAQSCPTLCDPMDYTIHGILQARILEWVAFPFSRGSSKPRDQTHVSCTAGRFFTTEPPKRKKVKSLSCV